MAALCGALFPPAGTIGQSDFPDFWPSSPDNLQRNHSLGRNHVSQ